MDLAAEVLETTPLLLREIRSEIRLNSETGISIAQFRILAQVRYGTKSNKDIALCLGLSDTTTSRMIQQLVERGLLDKAVSVQSRREVRVSLSKSGRSIFDQVHAEARKSLSVRFQGLSSEERSSIHEAFQMLNRLLSTPSDQSSEAQLKA